MEQTIVIVLLFTVILILFKVIEYKFIDKEFERKPLKYIVRDIAFGCAAAFLATTIYFYNEQTICSFFNIITNGSNIVNVNPVIMTGDPGF